MSTAERRKPAVSRPMTVSDIEDGPPLWARPGFLVRRLHQITVAIFLDEMADLDLTPVQFGALTVVNMRPGIEQSAIGEELGIDRVNAGDVVQRLMKNELVVRTVSARDRRYKEVWLTPQGEQVLQEGTRRMKQVQARLMSPLQPQDQTVFLSLLMQLISGNNDQGRALLRLPARSRGDADGSEDGGVDGVAGKVADGVAE